MVVTNRVDLKNLAEHVMREKGLQPTFEPDVVSQIASMKAPAIDAQLEDLTSLLWCSIDNDDSKDLDQLTYAEHTETGFILWVAVADVDALVKKDSPVDRHAQFNTTSVYTPAAVFSMLPEQLSTNLTSLNEQETRLAVVVKVAFDRSGQVMHSDIFRATVYNWAKLTYRGVGKWLEEKNSPPEKIKNLSFGLSSSDSEEFAPQILGFSGEVNGQRPFTSQKSTRDASKLPEAEGEKPKTQVKNVPGLEATLLLQNQLAQLLRQKRIADGSIMMEPLRFEPRFDPRSEDLIEAPEHNLAHELIEECMVAANIEMARYLQKAGVPSLRRVVKKPKRWDRIVQIAREYGFPLPELPDSKSLADFLNQQKQENPLTFPDLSLIIVKLLGRGEYIVSKPGSELIGHFGLAVPNYTHSTAPNRRFPDLLTQRQFKGESYSFGELEFFARHCTSQEDAANKVERHLNKSAAALILTPQIGKSFSGIVTGASEKGTWVRIFKPPIEGKLVRGFENLDVGDRVTVQLVDTNVSKGFIDFIRKN